MDVHKVCKDTITLLKQQLADVRTHRNQLVEILGLKLSTAMEEHMNDSASSPQRASRHSLNVSDIEMSEIKNKVDFERNEESKQYTGTSFGPKM